jgi:uncharacterized repeat protein (TIGR03803 family)
MPDFSSPQTCIKPYENRSRSLINAPFLPTLKPEEPFKLTQDGTFSVLHTFGYGANDLGGSDPAYALIQGADGALYGTTKSGGANGQGTLFSFANGTFTTLYSFGGSNTDGANPNGIILGSDGAIYGSTVNGGTAGSGTIFKIALSDAPSSISNSKSGGGGAIGLLSLLCLSLYLIVRLRSVSTTRRGLV